MASLTMPSTTSAYVMIVNKANGLRSADTFGKSDPYVKISCPAAPSCLDETTQVIQSSLNPIWGRCYLVCLPSSIPPVLKFSVYDSDKGTFVDGTDDFLGHAGLNLSEAVSSNVDTWHSNDLVLGGDKARGTLNILVKAYEDPTIVVERATKLRNADGFFGKSDPYARLSGLTGTSMVWGETKTIRDNLNPLFENESFTIPLLSKLPTGGSLCPFKIEMWDEDDKKRSSSDDPLGIATIPWVSLFPDPGVPKLAPLKLADRGAKSGSTVTVSVTMPLNSNKQLEQRKNLAGVGRSLLQNAISLGSPSDGGPPPVMATVVSKPVVKISKSACKANLSKGLGFKIADCTDNIADRFTMGLAWDMTNGVAIDLDASCIWLDSTLQPIDTVWFQKLRSADGSMQHCGDEREGDEVGDDESIMFDLERVSPRATYLCFCINSFTGQRLNNVASAKCRMYNTSTLNEVASFDLSKNSRLDSTALLMCILYRAGGPGTQEWFMYAVGEPAEGRTVQDNVDEFQAFLMQHPLATLSQNNVSKPPQMAKIQVPQNTGQNNTIGFKLPSGASEQVKLPPSVQPGDMVEVPLIDVFAV